MGTLRRLATGMTHICLSRVKDSASIRLIGTVWEDVAFLGFSYYTGLLVFPTVSPDNFFQCLTTLTVKNCFLLFIWNLCLNLCPLSLVLLWVLLRSLVPSFFPIKQIYAHCWDPPWAFSSQSWTVTTLSASPHMKDVTYLKGKWFCTRSKTSVNEH